MEKLADILYSAQDKNLKPYGLRAAVYDKISDMIGGINVDDAGQKRFEAELNKLYGGIMTQFRREFHDLLDETDIRFSVVLSPVSKPLLYCGFLIYQVKVQFT